MEIRNQVLFNIYGSAQDCTASEFSEYALAKLKKIMQFDSAVMVDCSVTPTHEFFIQSLHLHAVPLEKLLQRKKVIGFEKLNPDGSLNSRDTALKNAYAQAGKSVITDVTKVAFSSEILNYCREFEGCLVIPRKCKPGPKNQGVKRLRKIPTSAESPVKMGKG